MTGQEVVIAWSRVVALSAVLQSEQVLTEVAQIAAARHEATIGAVTVTTTVVTTEVAVTSAMSEAATTAVATVVVGMTTVVEIAGTATTDTVGVRPRPIEVAMMDMAVAATTVDHLPVVAMNSRGLDRVAVTVTSQTMASTVGCHHLGRGLPAAVAGANSTLPTCHLTSPRTLWIMFLGVTAVCKTST